VWAADAAVDSFYFDEGPFWDVLILPPSPHEWFDRGTILVVVLAFGVGITWTLAKRRRAEAALRESEERFRLLAENMSSGVAVYRAVDDGADFRFVAFNKAAERIERIARTDVVGRSVLEVFPGVREFGLFEVLQHVWRTGEPKHFPVRLYQDERITGWRDNYVFRLPTGEVAAVYDDVTARKKAEERSRRDQRRLRRLMADLARSEERERRRLAAGLHDGVGQALATAKMRLQMLERETAGSGLAEPLALARQLVEEALEYIRTFVFDLSPAVLHELGLEPALESLAERASQLYDLDVRFENDGRPKPLTDEARDVLYRAVRELLHNAARHARATHVTVRVRHHDATIQVRVEDDGVGFDPKATQTRGEAGGGFGLYEIRERLHYLGGCADIWSEPGRGTRVTLTAPLSRRRQGECERRPS